MRYAWIYLILLFLTFLLPFTSIAQTPEHSDKISTGTSKKKIETLVDKLGASSYQTREQAQTKILQIGAPAVPVLKQYVSSDNPEIRSRVLTILKKLGAWTEIPELAERRAKKYLSVIKEEKLFYNGGRRSSPSIKSWTFRKKIRNVFGKKAPVKPSKYMTAPNMKLLMQQAERSNITVMTNLAFLFRFGPPDTAAPILSRLAKKGKQETKRIALNSLAALNGPFRSAQVQHTILKAIDSNDTGVQREALRATVKLPRKKSIPLLLETLTSNQAHIRFEAFYSLRDMTDQNIYYNAWWKPERRKKRIENWKSWWKKQKSDPSTSSTRTNRGKKSNRE